MDQTGLNHLLSFIVGALKVKRKVATYRVNVRDHASQPYRVGGLIGTSICGVLSCVLRISLDHNIAICFNSEVL